MRPTQTPHRTPLRRISQGSLLRLSRSGAYPNAPHGLGFLEPALSEFLDETEALQTNVEGLKNLSNSLATFNESFASWLYIMNMNALTTDWPQVREGFNIDRERLTTISGTNRCLVHPCEKTCR
jgi:DASH complex subunit DAM1